VEDDIDIATLNLQSSTQNLRILLCLMVCDFSWCPLSILCSRGNQPGVYHPRL
jgi:hypothetical protein